MSILSSRRKVGGRSPLHSSYCSDSCTWTLLWCSPDAGRSRTLQTYTCLLIKSRLYVFANYQSLMSESRLSQCVCVFWRLMSEWVCLCVLKSNIWVDVFVLITSGPYRLTPRFCVYSQYMTSFTTILVLFCAYQQTAENPLEHVLQGKITKKTYTHTYI